MPTHPLSTRLLGLLFVVGIAAPATLFAIGQRSEASDNRPKAEIKAPSAASLRDASWFELVDQAMIDRLPLRDRAIEIDARIDLDIFGDSPNDRVKIGADGWLFFTESLDQECLSNAQLLAVAEEIGRIEQVSHATGIDFAIWSAPDKASVAPGRLSGEIGCVRGNAELIDALVTRSLIPIWSPIVESGLAADDLYYISDTHWKTDGARIASREIINHLEPGLWDAASIEYRGLGVRETDLSGMIGRQRTEDRHEFEVNRPGFTTNRTQSDVLDADGQPLGNLVEIAYETTGSPVIGGSTLVLHDSFGWNMIDYLHPYFERSVFIRRSRLDLDYMSKFVVDTDRILFGRVQRAFFDSLVKSHLADTMVEALFPRLPSTEIDATQRIEISGSDSGDRYLVLEDRAGPGSHTIDAGRELTFTRIDRLKAVRVDRAITLDLKGLDFAAFIVDIPDDR